MSFELSLPVILSFEGGYSNNPNDPGGPTNKGITQRTYNAFRVSRHLEIRDVRSITNEEVETIYKRDYWISSGCRQIPDSYPRLQLFHFDTAVNCGVITAIRQLQIALGVRVDGVFGPITAGSILSQDENKIIRIYSALRCEYYLSLIRHNPKLKEFEDSWFDRVSKICLMNIPQSNNSNDQNN